MRYLRLFTIRRVKTSIALMWLSLFAFFVVHKLTWSKYYYDRKAYVCSIDFPQQWRFTLFVIATIVVPPAIIIVYCNYTTFKVTRILRDHKTCTFYNHEPTLHVHVYVYAIRAKYCSFNLDIPRAAAQNTRHNPQHGQSRKLGKWHQSANQNKRACLPDARVPRAEDEYHHRGRVLHRLDPLQHPADRAAQREGHVAAARLRHPVARLSQLVLEQHHLLLR